MILRTALPFLLPLALSLAACKSAPTAAPAGPTQPSPKPAPLALAAAVAPMDETPIPDKAPSGLLVLGRIANLRMTWANADRLLLANGGSPIPVPVDMVALSLVGPSLADLVDIGAPMDAAVMGTPPDRFVVSFSLDPEMVPRLGKIVRVQPENGMLRITSVRGETMPSDAMLGACALTNPEEDPAQRLVCASDEELLAEAGGYLGRKVAREPSEGDVRVELGAAELFHAFLDEPSGPADGHAAAMGESAVKTFFADLGKVGFSLSFRKNELDLELGLGFRALSSPLSSLLSARALPSSRPPEMFWRLPKDAAFSMYSNVQEARALAPLRDDVLRALSADLAEEGYDQALLDDFGRRVSSLYLTGGPVVIAAGVDRNGAEKALGEYFAKLDAQALKGGKPKGKPDRAEQLLREKAYKSVHSWMVMGVEEPPETWAVGLRGLVDAGNTLDAKRNGGLKPSGQGAALSKALPKDGPDRHTTTITIAKNSPSAPKGSLHIEVRTRPLVEDAPPLRVTHYYVVPDGARTWMGFGDDEGEVLKRLALVREGLPDKTLASVPDLDLVRAPGAMAGGCFTLAGAWLLWEDADRDSALRMTKEALSDMSTLPSRGETMVPWALVTEEDAEAHRRTRLRARLVVGALMDLVALAKK